MAGTHISRLGRPQSAVATMIAYRIEQQYGPLAPWSSGAGGTPAAIIVFGQDEFAAAKSMKSANGAVAVFGVREYPAETEIAAALEQSYGDLLENRFALSVGIVGGQGFVLTGERGIALGRDGHELAEKLAALVASRAGQQHNTTRLTRVQEFSPAIKDDCADMFVWMKAWEKLALFPGYQREDGSAVYPGAEFGFVAKRTAAGTLVTARASNKTDPSGKDITLITDVTADGAVDVTSLGRKASLNGPLAHLIFAARPEVNYIVHSHIFVPGGADAPAPSAPGTQGDWQAIAPYVSGGETVINQPCHGTLILLERAEDLLPLLKERALYNRQSELYDTAYARFQGAPEKPTNLEKYIAGLDLPQDVKILDLCCGTGASTLALKAMGFHDIDFADGAASMLAVAEKRMGKAGRLARLQDVDALNGKAYDLVTMRQAFNYVAAPELRDVFRKVSGLMASGGQLVFNSFMPLPDGVDRRSTGTDKDGVTAQTSEINHIEGRLIRHAQRTEIVDMAKGQWHAVHDINEFYQHAPADVLLALREEGFDARVRIAGNSVCYHAIKPA